ncbi:glycosidase, partial [candidate division WOR-3 bacterium]|nr:glycosidase [candidate division WOR-3 bacterium]
MRLKRYEGNPIITPIEGNEWESKTVFNCAAVHLDGKVHIVYRARDKEDISRLGYAVSKDGFKIDERLKEPIYTPQGEIEKYGCEDPRISIVGDRLHMSYTAYGE